MNLASLVIDEINLIGSRCGPFREAIAPCRSGRSTWRSDSSADEMKQGVEAMKLAAKAGVLKVILGWSRLKIGEQRRNGRSDLKQFRFRSLPGQLAALRKLAKTQGTSAESCATAHSDGLAMELRPLSSFDETLCASQGPFSRQRNDGRNLDKL